MQRNKELIFEKKKNLLKNKLDKVKLSQTSWMKKETLKYY